MRTDTVAFERTLTWRERLICRIFPVRWCELPEAPAEFKDVLEVQVGVGLDIKDRLRLLLTGKLKVRVRIVCEEKVGATVSNSVAYPVLNWD